MTARIETPFSLCPIRTSALRFPALMAPAPICWTGLWYCFSLFHAEWLRRDSHMCCACVCQCTCFSGWSGTLCDQQVDECQSAPCLNGATCVDLFQGYTCQCAAGFSGVRCQTNLNECSSAPCSNGGTCVDQANGFACVCAAGFSGLFCQTEINECGSQPCMNGGTCVDVVNGFTCQCRAGYAGPRWSVCFILHLRSSLPVLTTVCLDALMHSLVKPISMNVVRSHAGTVPLASTNPISTCVSARPASVAHSVRPK
jgi:hypothetical protein